MKTPPSSGENISHIDPTRKTVGSIYLDAQKNYDAKVTVGDIVHELQNSLVEDLNETIASNPFDNRPFYILIYEKKDLQMKKAILRRLYCSEKRPYPEDDTVVFWTDPKRQETRFCWCLPHYSDMHNILLNQNLYDPEMVADVKAWRAMDLSRFGFIKDKIGNWIANPKWEDKPLKKEKPKILLA